MGYRDASESLRAYRDRVATDLEEARRAARDVAEHAKKVAALERELTETDGLLDKMGGKRRGLPVLESLQIAAPCKASWDDMVGDQHVRFCGQCEKNVYNLSSLPREEAEALLLAREGSMCVRMYKRADGTVLTADCPVGVKKRRRRRTVVATVGGGLMAAAAALGLEGTTQTTGTLRPVPQVVTMGEPVAVPIATTPDRMMVQGGIGPEAFEPPAKPKTRPKQAPAPRMGKVAPLMSDLGSGR